MFLEFFSLLDLVCEKEIAQNDWNGYFCETEKVGLNSLSVESGVVENVELPSIIISICHRLHGLLHKLSYN